MLSNAPVSVVLPASDLERAKKFYTEVIGLQADDNPDMGGFTLKCGDGSQIFVYQRPGVKIEHTQASFLVEDIDAEMADLRGRGLQFEDYDFPGLKTENGVATMEGFKSAWFKDSEGNILALGQETK